jgi:hypothetical protein
VDAADATQQIYLDLSSPFEKMGQRWDAEKAADPELIWQVRKRSLGWANQIGPREYLLASAHRKQFGSH